MDLDYIVIGSGFGGSVSALRLAEKGYKVMVLEKGKRYEANDFPKSNWRLRKWFWLPSLRFFGFFKLTFFRHAGILSGVGVGGGSLVYANTLPRPESAFFNSGSWAGLADWENELAPFYKTAEKMLGAAVNPGLYDADDALRSLATQYDVEDRFQPTFAAVYFGEPEKKVADPYFGGEGPDREGCRFCGGCMTGCRYNAKNTLDKNYLWLAEKKGVQIKAEARVTDLGEWEENGEKGYRVSWKNSTAFLHGRKHTLTARGVILAGGVLGTVRLLLDMKRKTLPGLSPQTGNFIRTNNESLILVSSKDKTKDFSRGIAIGSIFPPDKDTHLEPVRYSSGSGFWKTMGVPLTYGRNIFTRTLKLLWHLVRHPRSWLRIYFTKDFAKSSVILLFMQHLDSTLKLRRGIFNLASSVSEGEAPTAFIPFAGELADKTARIINGKPFVMATEALFGIPTTAHILGGSVIGRTPEEGVVDKYHRVFGYENLLVCDGSAVSANPGVNPSLTITAMAERAMSFIPEKGK